MSKKVLNYVRLGDVISESFLLMEMSPYGCPDEPGKIYGYNPFEKKCVDITGYEGPDRPAKIKTISNVIPKPGENKPGYKPSVEGGLNLLLDVKNILTDFEAMKMCYDDHPVASFAGLLVGGYASYSIQTHGLVRSTGKLALKGLGLGGKVVKVGGKTALKLINPKNLLTSLILGAVAAGSYLHYEDEKASTAVNVARIITGPMGDLGFGDWAKAINQKVQDVDDWTDLNKDNIACFGAAVVGSVALYGLAKGAGAAGRLFKRTNVYQRGSKYVESLMPRLGKSLDNAIKGRNQDSAFLLLTLKNQGMLADDIGVIATKAADGKPLLKLSKDFGEIRVPLSDLPDSPGLRKKMSKFVQGEDVVLNADEVAKSLAEISDEVFVDVSKVYNKEAKEAVKSMQGQNLGRLMKLIGRMDEGAVDVTTNYFKATGKIYNDVIQASTKPIQQLYGEAKQLRKLENVLGNPKELERVRGTFMKSGSDPAAFISNVDMKKFRGNPEDVADYLNKFRKYTDKEKLVTADLQTIQALLDGEAKFAKTYSSGASKTPLVRQFIESSHGDALKGYQNKLRGMLGGLRDVAQTQTLASIIEKVFLLGGVAGAAYGIVKVGEKMDEAAIRRAKGPVLKILKDFKSTITLKKYFEGDFPNEKINADKMLDDFYKFSTPEMISKHVKNKVSVITIRKTLLDFVQLAKKEPKVESYFNEQRESTRRVGTEGDLELQKEFEQFITVEFSREDKEIEKPETADEPAGEEVVTKSSIVEQFPEGQELVGKGPMQITLSGKKVSVKFGEKAFTLGKEKFQFTKGGMAATIDSAMRKKKILIVKLSVLILSEEYRLDDSEIEKLFNATRKLKKRGDTTEIKLDNKEGVIRKLEESREVKIMSEESLSEMVKKILTENSGKGYSQYPYGSSVRDDEEPAQDYMEDWKALSVNLIRDESRDTAISIAKILVKDLELFEDVLDLAGQNQSVGQEILRKLQELEEEA